jgi:hypothetical protein
VSEELVLLKEYIESLRFDPNTMTLEDLTILSDTLNEAGEFGLAGLVEGLEYPYELLEYIGEEE